MSEDINKLQTKADTINFHPIKSQMVIVSSTEMPLSSDDSETIDVGTENFVDFTRNPWGDLDVNKIPIKIVDDLHETGDS